MSSRPPYLSIAAEIGHRIRSGELAPGERVPSTRAITREWGVAMATATKVLAELRREGLVRPEPGVGTVVVDPAAHPAGGPAGGGLSRERIVAAAVALADAEGLGAVTMRRLATALSVPTTALYRQVPGQGELVRLMADAVFAEVPLGPVPAEWRPGLERAARWLRGVYARHGWMAHAMAGFVRPVAAPHAMAYAEWVLGVLRSTPLSAERKLFTHLTLLAYVQGMGMAGELEARARQDSGLSGGEWMDENEPRFDAIQSAGTYPSLHAMAGELMFPMSLDSLFEFGLGRTLDGIATMIDETSA
ncbi:TetR/AcrR family transcriptional regulator C-terminal domain-containing protein [Streptomyces sp. NPDC048659]|uniref:TetR/AcrR family transcriptional regulator C-terminal domain-containing protein n=1 Tax=Streptomyces sp. NPDC048659 TaxID=3155489 RepID=UPI00343AF119